MKQLVFLGSNSNLEQMVDLAELSGYQVVGLIDKDYYGNTDQICNVPVIGEEDSWDYSKYMYFNAVNYSPLTTDVHTRNNLKRNKMQWIIAWHQLPCATLIHPTAVVAKTAVVGHGVMICAGAVVSNHAKLGDHCQVREQSYVAHNATIGDNVVLQVQSYIGGSITVGDNAYIGVKGTVLSSKDSTYSIASGEFVRSCERRLV